MNCDLPLWQLTIDHWVTRRSEEQRLIDKYLSKTRGKSVLFVGIGDSTLAKLLYKHNDIDGITACWLEKEKAESMGIPNYKIYLLNKYHSSLEKYLGSYDLVVDTNPGTYRCCNEHFKQYLETIFRHLKVGGQLISHIQGIDYESPKIQLKGSVAQLSDMLHDLKIKFNLRFEDQIVIYEKTEA